MRKKILLLISTLIIMLSLSACSDTSINVTKEGNNLNTIITLDNSIIKATEKDYNLFEANGFKASITGNDLNVETVINYSKFEDSSKETISFLKQIISKINPSLKPIIDEITITPSKSMKGFSFSGTTDLLLKVKAPDDTIGTIYFTGLFDEKVSFNGNSFEPNAGFSTKIEVPDGENDYNLTFLDNDNVSSVSIKTVLKEKIESTVNIYFKSAIDTQDAADTLNKNLITDYKVNKNNVSVTFTYTTPEMFSALNAGDLYNTLGLVYMTSIDDTGTYAKRGSLDIKAVSNNGIEDVSYSVWMDKSELDDGSIKLSDGVNHEFKYSSFQSTNFIITLVVIISIGFVVFVLVTMAKRKK